MTDLSLLVDIRDDIISLAQSIKVLTDDVTNGDYLSILERLAVEGTKYSYEVQSMTIEAITLTLISIFFITQKTTSFDEIRQRFESNPSMQEDVTRLIPRTSRLVTSIYLWSKKESIIAIWWKIYNKSPSVLLHTPLKRQREFQVGKTRSRCTETTLCVEYYRNYLSGVSRGSKLPTPDAVLHLEMDHIRGADLKYIRKYFGLESLAVITNRSPFRRVFDPASDTKLSPVAVYDLTHQLREPLRVFEPEVSSLTHTKRKIHESVCDAMYIVYSLTRLLAGFPVEDLNYLRISYGPTYASNYERTGNVIRQQRIVVTDTISSTFDLFLLRILSFIQLFVCWIGVNVSRVTYQGLRTARSNGRNLRSSISALLCKAPSLAFRGTLQSTTHKACQFFNIVMDGQIRHIIPQKPYFILVPLVVWMFVADYYSTKP